MKKFITIAGAILLGTAAATQLTLEEKVVDGLLHGLQAAEKEVSLIKGQLQGIAHRRRARSVDSTPNVEALSRSYGNRYSSYRPTTKPSTSLHPIEIAKIGTDIISGLGNTGTAMYAQIEAAKAAEAQKKYYESLMNQPQVEGFLSGLGELTGIAGDLTGMGLGIYQTIEQPHVEGFLSGLHELTGIAGDLTGLGLGIYQTVHPHVQAQIEDEDDIEVQQYWDGGVYVRPTRVVYNVPYGGVIYPHD
ncbi:UNKNOWN [Stylonychia lemnae]|uniref:Uncharacterized protein n=1 Tax=Stylonychia lemnae TaxID=5949 RepID=A0A078A889_STYLE|nr:UNKNOWN [Stylonychia lemnae]|eukprot:CDW78475.1 UNKNOWN [Stylonychia lemnae]